MTFELTPTGPAEPTRPANPGESTQTLLDRLGGHDAVVRLVDAFYDRIEGDEELRAIFPQDLSAGREKQMLFMEQWFGGDAVYSQRYGHPRLRRRHFPFIVSDRGAGRWLRHMTEALRECGAADDVVAEMLSALGPLAHQMVNEGQAVPRDPLEDSFLS